MSKAPIMVTYYADPPVFTRGSVNDEYCRFFDVIPEQVIGRSCLETVPENNREQVHKKIEYCIQNDAVLISIESVIKPNGTISVIRWVDVPVKDRTGKIIKMLAIGSPMRDRRKNSDRRQPIGIED